MEVAYFIPNLESTEFVPPIDSAVSDLEQKIRLKLCELESISITERRSLYKFKIDRNSGSLLRAANEALAKICKDEHLSLTELNQLMYAAAAVLAGEVEPKAPKKPTPVEGPRWKMRLNNKIASSYSSQH